MDEHSLLADGTKWLWGSLPHGHFPCMGFGAGVCVYGRLE
jgi:hypothetical protein